MKRTTALAALLAAGLAACGGRSYGPVRDGNAVAVRHQTYRLLKVPDPDFERSLEALLTSSYESVVKAHSELMPSGPVFFAYSVTPKGAVYPMSEIEVSCLMQERYFKRKGPELCGEFFDQLSRRLKKELAARGQSQ